MTWDIMSFSTAFQTYLDDERVILKSCVQWNSVNDGKDLRLRRGSNPRALDQASAQPTELTVFHQASSSRFKTIILISHSVAVCTIFFNISYYLIFDFFRNKFSDQSDCQLINIKLCTR